MSKSLGVRQIRNTLECIGDCLSSERILILFGGCAMAVHGLKESTVDVDAVLIPPTSYALLIQDLRNGGWDYNKNEAMDHFEAQDDRPSLEAMEMWFHETGWLDLFPPHRVWHQGLRFSDGMQNRSTLWLERGPLTVRLADPSTIFLLKSITGRWHNQEGRDLDDLAAIMDRRPPDWEFVRSEWMAQAAHGLATDAVANAHEAIEALRAQGYRIPWSPHGRSTQS